MNTSKSKETFDERGHRVTLEFNGILLYDGYMANICLNKRI
jgi:hypothetical protein